MPQDSVRDVTCDKTVGYVLHKSTLPALRKASKLALATTRHLNRSLEVTVSMEDTIETYGPYVINVIIPFWYHQPMTNVYCIQCHLVNSDLLIISGTSVRSDILLPEAVRFNEVKMHTGN